MVNTPLESNNNENYRTLLAMVESRRQNWSNTIDITMGLAATLSLGILSFFLKEFFDNNILLKSSVIPSQSSSLDVTAHPFSSSYIMLALGLIAIVLVFWRLYAYYLDSQVTRLYPEILEYEIKLGIPRKAGIIKQISNNAALDDFFSKYPQGKQVYAVNLLLKNNRIGWRGHKWFDLSLMIVLGFFTIIGVFIILWLNSTDSFVYVWKFDFKEYPLIIAMYLGWLLLVTSIVFQIFVINKHPKDPDKKYLDRIFPNKDKK